MNADGQEITLEAVVYEQNLLCDLERTADQVQRRVFFAIPWPWPRYGAAAEPAKPETLEPAAAKIERCCLLGRPF
jgi:hypothetical protein